MKRIRNRITRLQKVVEGLRARNTGKRTLCSGLPELGLNLIRKMNFIKSRLMQDWIWLLSPRREQSCPRTLLLTTDPVSFRVFNLHYLQNLVFSSAQGISTFTLFYVQKSSLGTFPSLGSQVLTPVAFFMVNL